MAEQPERRLTDPLVILNHAISVYSQRSEIYGDTWRQGGWRGSVSDVLRKAGRVRSQLWGNQEPTLNAQDDLTDLIVYCAFALANIRDENEWGS